MNDADLYTMHFFYLSFVIRRPKSTSIHYGSSDESMRGVYMILLALTQSICSTSNRSITSHLHGWLGAIRAAFLNWNQWLIIRWTRRWRKHVFSCCVDIFHNWKCHLFYWWFCNARNRRNARTTRNLVFNFQQLSLNLQKYAFTMLNCM